MKATVPVMIGVGVFSFCCWRVHQNVVNRFKNTDTVEITLYGPDNSGEISDRIQIASYRGGFLNAEIHGQTQQSGR